MVLFMHLRWFLGLVVNFGSGCFKPSQTKSDSVYPVAQTPRTSEKTNSETLQNARKHDIKTCGCFLFVSRNYDKVFCTLDFVYTLSARINFYYYVLYALYFVLDDFFQLYSIYYTVNLHFNLKKKQKINCNMQNFMWQTQKLTYKRLKKMYLLYMYIYISFKCRSFI